MRFGGRAEGGCGRAHPGPNTDTSVLRPGVPWGGGWGRGHVPACTRCQRKGGSPRRHHLRGGVWELPGQSAEAQGREQPSPWVDLPEEWARARLGSALHVTPRDFRLCPGGSAEPQQVPGQERCDTGSGPQTGWPELAKARLRLEAPRGLRSPAPDSAQVLVFHGAPLSDAFVERRKPPGLDHPQGRALSSPSAHDPWCRVTAAPRHLEKEGLTALCLGPPNAAPPVFPGWLRPPAPHPAWFWLTRLLPIPALRIRESWVQMLRNFGQMAPHLRASISSSPNLG